MKNVMLTLLLIIGIAFAFGCDKSPTDSPEPATADEQEVLDALDSELELFPTEIRDNQVDDGATIFSGTDVDGAIAETIQPLRFGRQVLSRTHSRTVDFTSDSTATVTITMEMSGIFHIFGIAEGDTVPTHFEKPFADQGIRYAYLKKFAPNPDLPARWGLIGLTGTLIESPDGTVEIESIAFQGASIDTVVTDVLGMFSRNNILTVEHGDEVTVTVTTSHVDDEVFGHFRPWFHPRLRFDPNGDGTYTFVWHPIRPGVHHVTVDALSHGTLFDSDAPYDDMGWGLSYRVVPMQN